MPFEVEVKKSAFASTHFYIDEQIIRFDGKEIPISRVDGFGYYAAQEKRAFLNTGKLFVLFIYEKQVKKPHQLICMYAFSGGSGNESFAGIFKSLWDYIGNKQLAELHQALLQGKEVELQKYLTVNARGAYTAKPGLLKMGQPVFTEWKDIMAIARTEDNMPAGFEDMDVKNRSTGKLIGRYHLGWNNIRLFERYHWWLIENPAEQSALSKVIKT